MKPQTPSYVGSAAVRVATLALTLLCVAAIVLRSTGTFAADRVLWWVVLLLGLLALLGLVHCFHVVFTVWMKFADAIRVVMVTLLFGTVYFLIVPFLYLVTLISDPLKLRRRPGEETFWIKRSDARTDLESLQRGG